MGPPPQFANPGSGPSAMLQRLLSHENNIKGLRPDLTHPRGFDTGSTFINTALVMGKSSSDCFLCRNPTSRAKLEKTLSSAWWLPSPLVSTICFGGYHYNSSMQQPQQQKWRAALFGLSVPSLRVNVVEVLLEVGAEDLPGEFYFHCEPNLGTQAVRACKSCISRK